MIDIIYGSAQDIKHMRIRENVSSASEEIRCRRNVTSLHPPITRQSRPRQSVNIVTVCHIDNVFPIFPQQIHRFYFVF